MAISLPDLEEAPECRAIAERRVVMGPIIGASVVSGRARLR
jgi:hypothetical protein